MKTLCRWCKNDRFVPESDYADSRAICGRCRALAPTEAIESSEGRNAEFGPVLAKQTASPPPQAVVNDDVGQLSANDITIAPIVSDVWLYVSTELDALWIPNDHPGWRVASIWSRNSLGKIVAFHRLSESVWGWIHSRLIGIDQRMVAGETKGLPTRDEFGDIMRRLEVIDDFAEASLDPVKMRAAILAPPKKLLDPQKLIAVSELAVRKTGAE